jgi:hypothetical protein
MKYRRGCGWRKKGAAYVVNYPEPEIDPLDLDYMLLCPPWRPWVTSPTEIGIAPQGMRVIERQVDGKGTGIWDLYDWISESDYPHFPDFFEEARVYGTSRLIPSTTPFKLLSEESRHLFIHAKAIILEPLPFLEDRLHLKICPTKIEFHDKPDLQNGVYDHCTALLWEAVDVMKKEGERDHPVALPRTRPEGEAPTCGYKGAFPPFKTKVKWESAILMWSTIQRFEVVKDDIDQKHLKAIDIIEKSGTNISYILVDD